ncbi:MAG: translocation/assembly module TamB domain-containing protein, partial [Myxococcota bacterium]|nr:translocation/assembly module TamB domain-containing protein [Myxococcota bacterium]
ISDLVGIFLPIPGLDGRVDGTLSLSGEPLKLAGEARLDFRDIDFFGERFPEGNAVGLMEAGLLTLEQLILQRRGGAESLMTRGKVGRGYGLNLEVVGDGFALERLDLLAGAKFPVRGSLLLDGTVGGTLFAPEPRGRLGLQRTRLLGEPASSSLLRFETTDGELVFQGNLLGNAGDVSGRLGLNTAWNYQADGVLTELPWHLVYARAADGQPTQGTADGRFRIRGAWGDPAAETFQELELSRVDAAWRGHVLESLGPWLIQRQGGVITLDGVRLKGGATDVRLQGELGKDWVALTGGGEFDLELLEAATSHIGRAEGVGRLSFEQEGERHVTDPSVVVEVEDARFETPWFPHPFESCSGRVYRGPQGYRFEELRGRLGGGRLTGEGRLDASDWTPTRFDLGANLANGTVQYLDYLPPMRGNADLRFDGPVESLLVSGDIVRLDKVFGETNQWEEWVIDIREERLNVVDEVEGAEGLFSFDLSVSGDQSIHVSNNIAKGTCDARLRFIGNTARPGLSGWVRMEPGGRFTLQGRDFEVLRAELHYLEPWTFDPELDFLLQADVRSREDNYRIDYQVAGPFSGWNTQATSSPALSQGDINALLLFGMTRDELERFGGVNTALLVEGADLLLHGVGLEQVVSEGSGGLVDRVQVVTGISERGTVVSSEPRLVVEKRIGDSQGFDVIGEFNPNRPVDTYLGVERQLTEGLYVTFYRSGLEEDHGMELGGAYGADFKVRWDWD